MLTIQKVHHTAIRASRRPQFSCLGLCAFALTLCLLLPLFSRPSAPDSSAARLPIAETLAWVSRSSPDLKQFDYDMTIRIRLLFFWISKDDVGGGYIRRGVAKDDSRLELFQVLFGSDPAKCPKQINRWGAGTEAEWHASPLLPATVASTPSAVTASAFFGFMKSSKGNPSLKCKPN